MNKEDQIDEIDWLISELKPGALVEECHLTSLEIIGIECRNIRLSHSSSELLIQMLKGRRESLLDY